MAEALSVRPGLQPDITLELDRDGVILDVNLSAAIPDEDVSGWIGRPWPDTVPNPGREKVKRLVDDALSARVSGFRQINQQFPSGRELPFEFTAVHLGRKGLIVVGRSLKAVAELQSRLIAAQQAIERDYWKLRDVETRCRLLFDRATEAVLLLRASDLRILEANPRAMRALSPGQEPPKDGSGRELLGEIAPEEHAEFTAMLDRVKDRGKAPGILLHMGPDRDQWMVRASLLPSQDGLAYLLQLEPANEPRREQETVPVDLLIQRSPDALVALDATGTVLSANRAFLDFVQVGNGSVVIGEPLSRWLGRPGADMGVLLSGLERQGSVRLFSTMLQGELGASMEVEVSAVGDRHPEPRYFGLLIRDIESRLRAEPEAGTLDPATAAFTEHLGRVSLPQLVKGAVGIVERRYIEAALELTGGNRTAAAQLLGVSRQSLYVKLSRYGVEGEASSLADME